MFSMQKLWSRGGSRVKSRSRKADISEDYTPSPSSLAQWPFLTAAYHYTRPSASKQAGADSLSNRQHTHLQTPRRTSQPDSPRSSAPAVFESRSLAAPPTSYPGSSRLNSVKFVYCLVRRRWPSTPPQIRVETKTSLEWRHTA